MTHELGPLPEPHMRESYATAQNTSSVRKGYEQGGYLRWPDMYTADQMRSYAAAEVERAVAAERERCAKACDTLQARHEARKRGCMKHDLQFFCGATVGAEDCAEAIRALT